MLALTAAVGEAVSLAESSGIDPKLFLEAVSGGAMDCAYLQTKGNAIMAKSFEPAFTVQNALKDALLVQEAAVRGGVQLDVAMASTRSTVGEPFGLACSLTRGFVRAASAQPTKNAVCSPGRFSASPGCRSPLAMSCVTRCSVDVV